MNELLSSRTVAADSGEPDPAAKQPQEGPACGPPAHARAEAPPDAPACPAAGAVRSCACAAAASAAPEAEEELVDVVGCRSRRSGPVDFFRVEGLALGVGDKIMVETEVGVVLTEALMVRRMPLSRVQTGEFGQPAPVRGKAAPSDIIEAEHNERLAAEAKVYCRDCIRARKLDMKLVDVEVAHDRSKMAFYFTAPARIDFRELVKDLVRKYRTRIELRQIGVRHETQMVGAVGNCGMVCCCRRYLRKFAPVAIKMAKEQNVFLNPVKISGICGRLLCCLAYEQDNYDAFYRRCPKLGKKYQTSRGLVRVLRASMFRESVNALMETGEEQEFTLEEWHAMEPRRPEGGVAPASQSAPRQDRGGRPRRERSERQERPEKRDRPEEQDSQDKPEREAHAQSAAEGRARAHPRRPGHSGERAPSRPQEKRSGPDQTGGRAVAQPDGERAGGRRSGRRVSGADPALAPFDDVVDLPIDGDIEDSSVFGLFPRRSGGGKGGNTPE